MAINSGKLFQRTKEASSFVLDRCDRLLRALENERSYVARELHDGVAQTTLQLGLQAGICRKYLEEGKLDILSNELAQLEAHSQLVSSQVRELISDMRPPLVDSRATLDDYIRQIIELHTVRGGPPITYQSNWSDRGLEFSSAQVLALVRIVQESLLNVRKHAQAQNVWLTFSMDNDHYYVSIIDDGQGFDQMEVEARPADKGGAGLANIRMRAEAVGGSLSIGRNVTGQGTAVSVNLPK
jgi:signal transduction histidine kinase